MKDGKTSTEQAYAPSPIADAALSVDVHPNEISQQDVLPEVRDREDDEYQPPGDRSDEEGDDYPSQSRERWSGRRALEP